VYGLVLFAWLVCFMFVICLSLYCMGYKVIKMRLLYTYASKAGWSCLIAAYGLGLFCFSWQCLAFSEKNLCTTPETLHIILQSWSQAGEPAEAKAVPISLFGEWKLCSPDVPPASAGGWCARNGNGQRSEAQIRPATRWILFIIFWI
jgi:hypothetical protein